MAIKVIRGNVGIDRKGVDETHHEGVSNATAKPEIMP